MESLGALVGIEVREGKDKRLFKKWKHHRAGNPEKEDLGDAHVKKVKKGRGKLDLKVINQIFHFLNLAIY